MTADQPAEPDVAATIADWLDRDDVAENRAADQVRACAAEVNALFATPDVAATVEAMGRIVALLDAQEESGDSDLDTYEHLYQQVYNVAAVALAEARPQDAEDDRGVWHFVAEDDVLLPGSAYEALMHEVAKARHRPAEPVQGDRADTPPASELERFLAGTLVAVGVRPVNADRTVDSILDWARDRIAANAWPVLPTTTETEEFT